MPPALTLEYVQHYSALPCMSLDNKELSAVRLLQVIGEGETTQLSGSSSLVATCSPVQGQSAELLTALLQLKCSFQAMYLKTSSATSRACCKNETCRDSRGEPYTTTPWLCSISFTRYIW